MTRRTVRQVALLAFLAGCGPSRGVPASTPLPSRVPATSVSPAPSEDRSPAIVAPLPPLAQTTTAPPRLPPDVVPGQFTRVPLPNHKAALVVHGEASTQRALVYLHGVCGNVDKIRDWAAAASALVTTIALYGNKSCPTMTTRFSWNQDIEFIHRLVQTALRRVAEARGGNLDVDRVVLFGYSQGASRAERLAARYPESYPWVILGGPPANPRFENLTAVHRTALLVGSEEQMGHLREVALDLTRNGAETTFDVFDNVGHGSFGPSAPAVMGRTLSWLLQE